MIFLFAGSENFRKRGCKLIDLLFSVNQQASIDGLKSSLKFASVNIYSVIMAAAIKQNFAFKIYDYEQKNTCYIEPNLSFLI